MRKIILPLIILILVLTTVSGNSGPGYAYYLNSGTKDDLVFSVYNSNSVSLKNFKARAYMPYLEVYSETESFKLKPETPTKLYFEVSIPENVDSDMYPVILYLENDQGIRKKRVEWVYIR